MDIIQKINEIQDTDWIGYSIITKDQEILCLIDNFNRCCENFGYDYYIENTELNLKDLL